MKDNADEPTRIRINQYVIYFAIALVVLLPVSGGSLSLIRHWQTAGLDDKIEDRRQLLLNLPVLLSERAELLSKSRSQISKFHKAMDGDHHGLFESWLNESITEHTDAESAPGLILGLNVQEVRRLRNESDALLSAGAHHALNLLWHKASIYHLMPRGRPLLSGIGFISSGFGAREDPCATHACGNKPHATDATGSEGHSGVDFAAAPNSTIIATAPGVIIQGVGRDNSGYGLFVRIHHGLGYSSLYAHCSSLLVKPGERVKRGQPIALMGRTGRATGYHVHYEVRLGEDRPIDPMYDYILQK